MLSTWRGPAFLPHPAVDSSEKFIGAFAFIATNEDEAVRHASDVYNATGLGHLGIEVGIALTRRRCVVR
jgi:hypothetical protein